MTPYRLLIIDDEEPIRKLLKARFEREGYEVFTAEDGLKALEVLRTLSPPPQVLVSDLKMPGMDGFQMLHEAKKLPLHFKTIFVTGHGDKEAAIHALREGATDYLEKPFDLDELSLALKRCLKEWQLERENEELIARLEARVERLEKKSTPDTGWFESRDASMEPALKWLKTLARESRRSDALDPTVLILGESGTGKEGIARKIHDDSRRASKPWVALNCANLSEQLLESELFGHERGAFTGATTLKRGLFEIADGGTLFLDEIGEMDIKLQARLLRVLQEGTFRRVGGTQDLKSDVRIVAATNRNLEALSREGAFREDLYHRLTKVVIELPPLRSRRSDLIPMAELFCERLFSLRGKKYQGLTEEAKRSILEYPWPGNVRELSNVIDRAALLAEGAEPITPGLLGLKSQPQNASTPGLKTAIPLDDSRDYSSLRKSWIELFEREYLCSLLSKTQGNVSEVSRLSKIDRSNLVKLLKRHGIQPDAYRAKKVA